MIESWHFWTECPCILLVKFIFSCKKWKQTNIWNLKRIKVCDRRWENCVFHMTCQIESRGFVILFFFTISSIMEKSIIRLLVTKRRDFREFPHTRWAHWGLPGRVSWIDVERKDQHLQVIFPFSITTNVYFLNELIQLLDLSTLSTLSGQLSLGLCFRWLNTLLLEDLWRIVAFHTFSLIVFLLMFHVSFHLRLFSQYCLFVGVEHCRVFSSSLCFFKTRSPFYIKEFSPSVNQVPCFPAIFSTCNNRLTSFFCGRSL